MLNGMNISLVTINVFNFNTQQPSFYITTVVSNEP